MGKGNGGMAGALSTVSPFGAFAGMDTGSLGQISGSNKQAKYAARMAQAEQAQRQAVTAEARAGADRMRLAAQSPQQLAALESSLKAAQSQVDTDLRQLAAIDPAIMEASKQVLSLLQGGQAAVNGPAMQQRQQQRAALVNSLRQQYGPGAESSSIGQRALQQFDMQSDTMFQQNQMGTLGNMMNIATTRVNGAGIGNLLNTAQGFGAYQDRQLQAEQMGTAGILQGMSGEVAGAGAPFVSDMMKANFMRQKYNDVSGDMRQIGRTWGTMGMGGKGGGGGGDPAQKVSSSGDGGNWQQSQNSYWSKNPYE